MLAESYYLIQSRHDGRHLAAHPPQSSKTVQKPDTGFLLLFREQSDALSYLNIHARELASRFKIEKIRRDQLANLLKRWQFRGVGIVNDPLVPQVEFLVHE